MVLADQINSHHESTQITCIFHLYSLVIILPCGGVIRERMFRAGHRSFFCYSKALLAALLQGLERLGRGHE